MKDADYSERYYAEQGLQADRPALWFYARLLGRLCRERARILDFGCGTGHLLRRLSRLFEAYGYDPSADARNQARLTAPDAVVLEEWRPIPDGSLNAVAALHSLEHIERPLPVMQALAAKLAGGGLFFFVVPNPGGLGRQLKGESWFGYRDPTHCTLWSQGQWVMAAERAGLHLEWVRGDGMWDAPYIRLLPTSWQRALFGAPAALQLISPLQRPFIPPPFGECLIIAARKS